MRAFLSLIAAAALLFAPLQAGAVTAKAKTIDYYTTYYQVYPMSSPGEYPGRMTLTISPTGEISGRYRDEYAGGWVHVGGGLRGDKVWLTIGGAGGSRQVNGELHEDGTITGSFSHWRGNRAYKFVAVPMSA